VTASPRSNAHLRIFRAKTFLIRDDRFSVRAPARRGAAEGSPYRIVRIGWPRGLVVRSEGYSLVTLGTPTTLTFSSSLSALEGPRERPAGGLGYRPRLSIYVQRGWPRLSRQGVPEALHLVRRRRRKTGPVGVGHVDQVEADGGCRRSGKPRARGRRLSETFLAGDADVGRAMTRSRR